MTTGEEGGGGGGGGGGDKQQSENYNETRDFMDLEPYMGQIHQLLPGQFGENV